MCRSNNFISWGAESSYNTYTEANILQATKSKLTKAIISENSEIFKAIQIFISSEKVSKTRDSSA